jgi:DNA mismatch endonuclease (patch repair protein)
MAAVRSRDTAPEIMVRRAAHRLGYRFRLHRKDMPGSPDIVLPKYRTVIFVHGCFWHGHGCSRSKLPQSNVAFWEDKIRKNRLRDGRVVAALRKSGWKTVTLWQCDIRNFDTALAVISDEMRRIRKKRAGTKKSEANPQETPATDSSRIGRHGKGPE